MANSCACCGQSIPDNQGSRTCSMCYGDPDHGKDGYYQKFLDDQREAEEAEQDEIRRRDEEAPNA